MQLCQANVTAQGRVSIQFQHYWNPQELNYSGGKCDTFSACEYYFIICLNNGLANDSCTYGSLVTKFWEQSENVTFTVGEQMTDSGSVINPFYFDLDSYTVILLYI